MVRRTVPIMYRGTVFWGFGTVEFSTFEQKWCSILWKTFFRTVPWDNFWLGWYSLGTVWTVPVN